MMSKRESADIVVQASSLQTEKPSSLPSPKQTFDSCEPPLTRGSCVLHDPKVAEIVQKALLNFEGDRYRLAAWCIMPNHVHVVLTPLGEHGLSDILHSWKSFTSNKINKAIGHKGPLWELMQSLDHNLRGRL